MSLITLFFALIMFAQPAYAQDEAILIPMEPEEASSDAEIPTELLARSETRTDLASGVIQTQADAKRLCESFVEQVVQAHYDAAFEAIRSYFPVSNERVLELEEKTRQQLGIAELQFGSSLGYRFVSADSVQDTVLRLRFLQLFERDAIYWEFVFYNPGDGWFINALGFDDELQGLFD